MAKKVKFGLRNVYYAKLVDGEYSTPVAIKGAVNLSLTRVGEDTPFYADDVVYYTSHSNQGYEGTLEAALLPDSFYSDILGMSVDANGAYIESANDVLSEFALGFEEQTDDKPRRLWFYKCTCSRPDNVAATKNETVTPQTETLNIKVSPRDTDNKVKVKMEKTPTNEAAFNAFFTEVYEAEQSI